MAVNFFGIGGMLLDILTKGLFWAVILFFMLLIAFGILVIRKNKKLQYFTAIITDIGGGKIGLEMSKKTRSGWFKSGTFLFGLFDYGREEYLKTKDGRKIQCGSSVDFHEINGRRGLIVKRKDDDPHILVPLTKIEISNLKLIGVIAPADFRDASVDIIKQAVKETKPQWEQIVQWIMLGGVIIFALISIILITQMVQRGQAEAKELILAAGQCGANFIATTAP